VGGEVEQLAADASAQAEDSIELDVPSAAVEDAPVVKLVHMLLTRAVNERASDVHIEPSERDVRVRFRVDGVLHEVMRPQKNIQNGLISRLKVMADINIAERRVPQDGRVSLKVGNSGVDLRVATLPTVWGEKVVIRILNKESVLLRLDQIGFSEEAFKRYEQSYRKPYGAILVTGPTGSGKSTTLYATLNIINQPHTNIITVEDPVEYRLPGVNQVQVNNRAGMTFAAALRSILRSDPDTIMVGEIRDPETAKMAIESALTGHFVLSTLHTNDAPGALTRLNEMGVEPFLTGSAVSAVLAQRLARKLCANCCEMYTPTPEELMAARISPDMAAAREGMVLYRKVGCPRCNRTGYKGRVGVFQLLIMTDEIESLAAQNAHRDEIERAAVAGGMRSLWDDGIAKAAAGLISLEELARVVSTF
jgi:type IV pilus assembly protein PilB